MFGELTVLCYGGGEECSGGALVFLEHLILLIITNLLTVNERPKITWIQHQSNGLKDDSIRRPQTHTYPHLPHQGPKSKSLN